MAGTVLEHPDLPKSRIHIGVPLLQLSWKTKKNQLKRTETSLKETAPTNFIGGNASLDTFDPILISLVKTFHA